MLSHLKLIAFSNMFVHNFPLTFQLLSNPQRVLSLIGTGTPRAARGGVETNLALIKM